MPAPARLPRVAPGQEIRAEHLNALFELAEGLGLTAETSGGLRMISGPAGRQLALRRRFQGWIKINGSPTGASYPWVQQIAQASGTWTNGALSGTASTDGAKEANGVTTVASGTIVWAERLATSNEIIFVY
jgi:hypothetical protein